MPYHLSRIRSDMDTRGDLDRYLKRDHQRVSNDAEWDFLNEYEYVRDVEIEASEISELAEKTVELRQTFGPATSSRLDRRVAVVAEKALAPVAWLARQSAVGDLRRDCVERPASIGFSVPRSCLAGSWLHRTSKGGSAPGLRWKRQPCRMQSSYLPQLPLLPTTRGDRRSGRLRPSDQGVRRIGHECRITRRGLRLERA